MTRILRLLFKFQTPYKGDIRFITGNAIRHALSPWDGKLDCSIGKFTDTRRLIMPKTYEPFFQRRTEVYLPPHNFETFYNKMKGKDDYRYFSTPECVTFDLIDPPNDLLESLEVREFLQFGGGRNAGFGAAVLHDSLWIDVDQLNLPMNATHLTLIAPILYLPGIIKKYSCRREWLVVWNHGKSNHLRVFGAGQFFRLKEGLDIPRLAREGILRRERRNHKRILSHFGFGEFVLNNFGKGAAK